MIEAKQAHRRAGGWDRGRLADRAVQRRTARCPQPELGGRGSHETAPEQTPKPAQCRELNVMVYYDHAIHPSPGSQRGDPGAIQAGASFGASWWGQALGAGVWRTSASGPGSPGAGPTPAGGRWQCVHRRGVGRSGSQASRVPESGPTGSALQVATTAGPRFAQGSRLPWSSGRYSPPAC